MHQRRGEVEPAAHPARVGADAAVRGPLEADPVEERLGLALPLGAGEAVEGRLQADQLAAGHQRIERRLLEGDPDRPADRAGVADDVVAGDRRGAAARAQERRQHPDGGGLAGPVRAEKRVDLALGDLEVHAVDGDHVVSELAPKPPYLDRGHLMLMRSSRCGREAEDSALVMR